MFTCSNSCSKSDDECTVVQYEVDAVKEEEIKALNKKQKNREKKKRK